jgi:hypothetical protein
MCICISSCISFVSFLPMFLSPLPSLLSLSASYNSLLSLSQKNNKLVNERQPRFEGEGGRCGFQGFLLPCRPYYISHLVCIVLNQIE